MVVLLQRHRQDTASARRLLLLTGVCSPCSKHSLGTLEPHRMWFAVLRVQFMAYLHPVCCKTTRVRHDAFLSTRTRFRILGQATHQPPTDLVTHEVEKLVPQVVFSLSTQHDVVYG